MKMNFEIKGFWYKSLFGIKPFWYKSHILMGISDGNPDVNLIADSEWTVVSSVLGIQFHVPKV